MARERIEDKDQMQILRIRKKEVMKREKRYRQFFLEGHDANLYCVGSNHSIDSLNGFIEAFHKDNDVNVGDLLKIMEEMKIMGVFENKDESVKELCDKSNERLKELNLFLDDAEWVMAGFFIDPEHIKEQLHISDEEYKEFLSVEDPFDRKFEELGVYEADKKSEENRKVLDGLAECKTDDEAREYFMTMTPEQRNSYMASLLYRIFKTEDDPVGVLKEHGVLPEDWSPDKT